MDQSDYSEPSYWRAPEPEAYGPSGYQSSYSAAAAPIEPAKPRRRRAALLGAVALSVAGIAAGVEATSGSIAVAGSGSASTSTAVGGAPGGSSGSSGNSSGSGGTTSSGDTTSTSATAAQQIGVVDVDVVLKYQSAEAAGTGMILTSKGEILTNNHVVDGATSIKVTVVATGKTYTATVVGTDPTDDIAVIQLDGASGLKTIKTAKSGISVGAAVTGVGNAGGTGGTPSAASGTVTAVNQTITATDANGSNSETLSGLIETNAAIEAGDSGGPLFNSADEVVGIDTAASASSATAASRGQRGGDGGGWYGGGSTGGTATANAGYAIPIATAVTIAEKIEAGDASNTIHLGYPAFLGISLSPRATGATIAGVVAGLPAARAGLVAGDVITAVGGTAISSATDLQSAVAGYRPGQTVRLTWADTSGSSHTASITLVAGPAD